MPDNLAKLHMQVGSSVLLLSCLLTLACSLFRLEPPKTHLHLALSLLHIVRAFEYGDRIAPCIDSICHDFIASSMSDLVSIEELAYN